MGRRIVIDPPEISDSESCWATATAALVEVDPKAAKNAMEQRWGDFFHRASLGGALTELTAENGPSQPAAFELLKQLDPQNAAVQLSVSDATSLLRSDSADDRTRAANALAHAVVSAGSRAAVLALLKPHVMGSNGRARLAFVHTFFYGASLHRFLELVAQGNSPSAATAEWLLNQLESGNNQPPLPPDFHPTQPAAPKPANAPDEHQRV